MERKTIYLNRIKEYFPPLLRFQDMGKNPKTRGCLFYPYWQGRENYANARWQEAVLTLLWFYRRNRKRELKERIEAATDFWCRTQNRDGSFPEMCKGDRSFSATAFSTFAVAEAADFIGMKKDWSLFLERAGDWLCRNDETILTNQEAAAALSLLKLYKITKNEKYMEGADKKLNKVLENQSEEGYYKEKKGYDLGYSTLTLEILGKYYLINRKREILESAKRFIGFLSNPPMIRNTRNTDWVILDGFEIFAGRIPEARRLILNFFKIRDVTHIPDDRHICTDLYRLCWAYDNAGVSIKGIPASIRVRPGKPGKPPKTPNILRPLGIHRFRKWRYIFK